MTIFFKYLIAEFKKLTLRERLLAIVAATILVYLVPHLLLLAPQHKSIHSLQHLDKLHQIDLLAINKTLALIQNDLEKGQDPVATDRAELVQLKKQIADAEAFLGYADDATSSQLSGLIRGLLSASPQLILLSLKTLPVETFYQPNQAAVALAGNVDRKSGINAQKAFYKHGVEVRVKGNYMELLAYMQNMQKLPRRLFWSEASMDVSAYPDAVLRLVVFSFSDKPDSPL